MAHQHHGHSHDAENVSDKVLLWAILINAGLSIFEFLAGLISGSVALMADALHNTNDAGALLVAYIARKIAKRGADELFTFGYRRAELIGAMIQLTALILVGLYLLYEAAHRFLQPEPLHGGWIMAAAGVALVVDIVTAWLLWAMAKGSLNMKAAFLHNLADAAASIAVLLGGAAIYWLNWTWIDPILTIVIAGYILYISFGLLKKTSSILMQGTPAGLDLRDIQRKITALEGVDNLHHLHVWNLDEHHRAMEAHIVIKNHLTMPEAESLKAAIKQILEEEFAISHSTLELESCGNHCQNDAANLIPEH